MNIGSGAGVAALWIAARVAGNRVGTGSAAQRRGTGKTPGKPEPRAAGSIPTV